MKSITFFIFPLLISCCLAADLKVGRPSGGAIPNLQFDELLTMPAGPRGFSFSEKAKALNGKRIRITGYMVNEENRFTNRFLLSPLSVQLHDHHYGLADDLPVTTLFVYSHNSQGKMIRYTPGPIVVSGVFTIGHREEPDGRVSIFQLALDKPSQMPRQERSKSKITKRQGMKIKNLKHRTPSQTKEN